MTNPRVFPRRGTPGVARTLRHMGDRGHAGALDVLCVAALMPAASAEWLGARMTAHEAAEAMAWLSRQPFARAGGDGIAIDAALRARLRAELPEQEPERLRDWRLALADRLCLDGGLGSIRHLQALAGLLQEATIPAPAVVHGGVRIDVRRTRAEQVTVLRGRDGAECAYALAAPGSAPAAGAGALLAPLLDALRDDPARDRTFVCASVNHGRAGGGDVLALVIAAALRAGVSQYEQALFLAAGDDVSIRRVAHVLQAVREPALDTVVDGERLSAWRVPFGPLGMLGACRAAVYRAHGLQAPDLGLRPEAAGSLRADDVREALRDFHDDCALAASALARALGQARPESIRALLRWAADNAFGAHGYEGVLRAVLRRGYLEPRSSHETVADELTLARNSYFRALRLSSERVAAFLGVAGSLGEERLSELAS